MTSRPYVTPGASPFRSAVERRSFVVVAFLRGLPRAAPGLLMLGILAGGIALRGVAGAACVAFGALVLTWLTYLSWPALPPPGRAVRVVVVALLCVLALSRLA